MYINLHDKKIMAKHIDHGQGLSPDNLIWHLMGLATLGHRISHMVHIWVCSIWLCYSASYVMIINI